MPWGLGEDQIFMLRPHLRNIPIPHLPIGYQELKNDEVMFPQWAGLLNEVFGGYPMERLKEQVLDEPQWRPDRVMLAGEEGRPVAMSMAWEEPRLWPHSGHVFWVAVLEAHRRRGLGRFVLTRALQYFAARGHRDAVVYTEAFRGAAISLYLELGFEPMVTNTAPGERERWQRVLSQLGKPELMTTLRDDYARVAGHTIVSA
jgi:ribosomal protein S18 acetylase RimI-like enzyme